MRLSIFLRQNLLILVLLCSGSVFANSIDCIGEGQRINSIDYAGLKTTKVRIVERQIDLQIGNFLKCKNLETARQAIEDLSLFKSVTAESQEIDNAVNIKFTVVEKRYLLAIPYVASTESGSLNYGIRGNWSNIAGLNQKGRLNIRKKTFSSDIKDSEKKAAISFFSPQINNSDYDGQLGFTYLDLKTRAIDAPLSSTPFNEVFRNANIGVSRWFHQGQRLKGWRLGSALSLRSWKSTNPVIDGLADADQSHLGIEFQTHYNQLHDRRYSFEGYDFTYRIEPSITLRGDKSPLTQELFAGWHKSVGVREHSEIEVQAGIGWSNGAYEDFVPFQNSSNAQLRGVSYDDFEGDRYYYLKTAYLTPFTFSPFNRTRLSKFPSLRAELFAEVDDMYFQNGIRNRKDLAWSSGAGVRWRVPWFVGVQIGAGIAYNSEEEDTGLYVTFR